MTLEEIINSPSLPSVVLALITVDNIFKDELKLVVQPIAADIESAATNPNCTCRNKVVNYTVMNSNIIGTLLFKYAERTNTLTNLRLMFTTTRPPEGPSASGRVAKTTVKEWPEFAKTVSKENLIFRHISTSIVGEDVYVFFL